MYNDIVVLGVLVSLILGELSGLSAGLVVPGYLALCLHSPYRILFTLAVAVLSALLCRLLERVVILYGRRRFAAVIVLSMALSAAVSATGLLTADMYVVGYIVPGIIANEFMRQGYLKTLLILFIATGAVALILLAVGYPVFGNPL